MRPFLKFKSVFPDAGGGPSLAPMMGDRQPQLPHKTLLSFECNEPLLCTHSVIKAIWLPRLNMPPPWKVLLRDSQLACDVRHTVVGGAAFLRPHDN